MGYEVTWNDLREDLIDYVKLKHEKGKIEFVAGNAFELNFDTQFDAVLITEIIEHVAHPDAFLVEVAKLVKPGGYIVMTTPNGAYFKNDLPKFSECVDPSQYESQQFKPNSDGHIFLLYVDEIKGLSEKAKLNVLETRLFTNFITNGHLKSRFLLPLISTKGVELGESLSRRLPFGIASKLHSCMAVLLQRS